MSRPRPRPGFWDLPPALLDGSWLRDPFSSSSSSTSSFRLHDPGQPPLRPRQVLGKEAAYAARVLVALYAQRPPRYCHLTYEQWLLQVRYHSIRPLRRPESPATLCIILCVGLMLLMVLYSAAMIRFIFGLPFLTTPLPYTPTFHINSNYTWQLVSGQAQWDPFGYAEVVTVRNTTAGGEEEGVLYQYSDSSDFDGSCSYSVTQNVTGFSAPTYANGGYAAPTGDSLSLTAPACGAWTSLLVCYLALCILLFICGLILLFAPAFCRRVEHGDDLSVYLQDLQSANTEPELSSLPPSVAALFKYEDEAEPPPPRCELPSVERMLEYVGLRLEERRTATRRLWRTVWVVGCVLCAVAVATLVSVVKVLREPGYDGEGAGWAGGGGNGTGAMLPLMLVSCCVPLLVMPCYMAATAWQVRQDARLAAMLAAHGHRVIQP